MKYLAGILLAVSIFNAFVMWCMCAMGAIKYTCFRLLSCGFIIQSKSA